MTPEWLHQHVQPEPLVCTYMIYQRHCQAFHEPYGIQHGSRTQVGQLAGTYQDNST